MNLWLTKLKVWTYRKLGRTFYAIHRFFAQRGFKLYTWFNARAYNAIKKTEPKRYLVKPPELVNLRLDSTAKQDWPEF